MRRISLRHCRKRLAVLWFALAPALFLLFVVQSMGGKYGDRVDEAWSWFLPTIMPTLSLMIGVLVLDATNAGKSDTQIEPLLFRMAFGLSLLYLGLLVLLPLVQPLTGTPPLELMKRSNLWLGPLQGLVAAVLGAFFVSGERGAAA